MARAEEYTRRSFSQLLRKNGYRVVRKSGSHHIWENDDGDVIAMSMAKEPNRMVVRRVKKEHNLK